ncbi:MAG: cytidylate kinase-like family protein [Lachnospiraceae bacterium]|nr:cytidylate kinase-like family protein [Lachnospiraceae bacterium]
MNGNFVVTIGRQLGSGGREIGQKVAEKLGYSFYDKNLIDMVASQSGLNKDVLHEADEHASSPFLSSYMNPSGDYATINDKLYFTQSAIIKELADKESCVIVGRCSDYVLREYANCLHVFVYAPLPDRVKRIMIRHMLDNEEDAKKVIQKEDKRRRTYYQYYTDRKWASDEGRQLAIDSSYLGIDGTADLIAKMVQIKLTNN